MRTNDRKRQMSDGGNDVPPKKQRAGSPSRRSQRVSKGKGGAAEQLMKFGDAIAAGPKKKPDPFAAAGEGHNPAAPGTFQRTKHQLPTSQALPPKATKPDGRFGLKLPTGENLRSTIIMPSAARGRQIIADERKRYLERMKMQGDRKNVSEAAKDLQDNQDCLPGDEAGEQQDGMPGLSDDDDHGDEDDERHEDWFGDEDEDEDEGEDEGEDEDEDGHGDDGPRAEQTIDSDQETDNRSEVGHLRRESSPDDQANEDANVLEEHYSRNRPPRPPSPARLLALNHQNAAAVDGDESDNDAQSGRQRRYSKTPKQDCCSDPTQLGFYPPKWQDFLEDCKAETRTHVATRDPWPARKLAMTTFIPEAIDTVVAKWRREQCTVERGFYPTYRQHMCKLLFEDIASWRGEVKKVAAGIVRSHYELFPPADSGLSKTETRRHVRSAAEALIKKSMFVRGGKDAEGHTNNFGHKAIRELLHVFLFSRENRIGNLRPNEFGSRIPTKTLTLGVTAMRCILDGYRAHGKAKFPHFSKYNYASKWCQYNELVGQLAASEVHSNKFTSLCREIARTGIANGGIGGDSDGDSSNDGDYAVELD